MHRLTQEQARRIAVRAQRLSFDNSAQDLLEVVRSLTLVQLDPTRAVAPAADLILWSRLGQAYAPSDLVEAIEVRSVIELQGLLRAAEDVALFRAEMEQWPGPSPAPWQEQQVAWLETNHACVDDILARLEGEGPLRSREIPDTCVEPWQSSGWNDNKNVIAVIRLLVRKGLVACAGRKGRERTWDLAERVYPDDPVPDVDEARRIHNERWLRSLGITRSRTTESGGEVIDIGTTGEPAVIEGVAGEWRLDPDSHGAAEWDGRTALISPFDRLAYDRARAQDLFGFDYQLEMYKPAAKRRWGYFALPILHDDQLVGKLDATADRRAGVFRVEALHEDVRFDAGMRSEVMAEIEALALWLGLEPLLP